MFALIDVIPRTRSAKLSVKAVPAAAAVAKGVPAAAAVAEERAQ